MLVPARLVPKSQLSDALTHRFANFPGMLPMSLVDRRLAVRTTEVVDWVSQRLSSDFQPAEELNVAASKPGHGIRPLAIWDLPTTIAYGALASQIASSSGGTTLQADWETFQRAPLSAPGNYIVSADISAYYQYIDHALLAQELLARDADGETVSTLTTLLYEVAGKSYGLPQQSTASDELAELFMQRLHRALVRRGLTAWRYNDDFRISCSSWPQVIQHIEVISDEARRIGLVLNDSKLLTWTRDRYEEHLDEATTLLEQLVGDAEIDVARYLTSPYDDEFDPDELDEDEVQARVGMRVLESWLSVAGDGRVSDENRSTYGAIMRLMSTALRSLTAANPDSTDAVDTALELLRYEQPLTPRICAYLDSRTDRAAVLSAFDQLLDDRAYLNDWQAMWLLNSMGSWEEFDDGELGVRRSWLSSFSGENVNPVTRGFALVAMSEAGRTDIPTLMKIYDRISPIVQPLIVAAIGMRNPSSELKNALVDDSTLNKLVIDAT